MYFTIVCAKGTWHLSMQHIEKIDAFSFGVVVLEVISGRKIIDYNLLPNDVLSFGQGKFIISFIHEVCALVDFV
jgi:hypothetical protein